MPVVISLIAETTGVSLSLGELEPCQAPFLAPGCLCSLYFRQTNFISNYDDSLLNLAYIEKPRNQIRLERYLSEIRRIS